MPKPKTDVLQGTLDLLVLKVLEKGPMHGYGIASHIARISDELLRVEEGSLYPALHRIEQGWQFIAIGSELRLMLDGTNEILRKLGGGGQRGEIAKY